MRRPKDYLLLYLKGVGIGAADVIPGVSGGTIAFITGIYEELIFSVRAIDRTALRLFFSFQLAAFWKKINGNFLFTVMAGVITSVMLLFKFMSYFLKNNPISISSFFFGVILVSTPLILREVKQWNMVTVLTFLVGIALAYTLTVISPTEIPTNLLIVFICGFLTASATMLPGISAIFVLLLLGKYEYMMTSILNLNIAVISIFVLGCFSGLVGFSRALSLMLNLYRFPMLTLLAGIMIGSLNKLWPWKIVTGFRLDLAGIQTPAFGRSVWPGQFDRDPQLFHAILFLALGIFVVVAIEKTAGFIKSKS